MRTVIEVLRARGADWTGFIDLCHLIDVPTDGLSVTMDRLERLGLIETKELYFGADPLAPEVPPEPYAGFQWGYRVKA